VETGKQGLKILSIDLQFEGKEIKQVLFDFDESIAKLGEAGVRLECDQDQFVT